jgi:hypothetical protein
LLALVLFFWLFSSQNKIFDSVYGRTKNFRLTQSSRPSRVKGIRPCLIFHVFVKGIFWFKGVFEKHLILDIFILRNNEFCQTKSKTIIKNIFFLAYGQKS